MEEVKYIDVTGIKFFRLHELLLPYLGIQLTDVEDRKLTKAAKWVVSLVFVACVLIQFYSTAYTIPGLAREGKFQQIGMALSLLSTCVSALDKYYVALTNLQSIFRIGQFAIRNRAEGRREGSKVESLVRYAGLSFYFGIFFIFLSWAVVPFVTSHAPPPPPATYPFPHHLSKLLEFPVRFISTLFMFAVVAFTATVTLKSLAFLSAQVQYLKEEIPLLNLANFKQHFPKFVERHVAVNRLHDDVNRIMSGIFLFQVLISTFLSAIFIFGVRFNSRIEEALYALLPIGISSTIEIVIFCKLGEDISQELEAFHREIYRLPWYEMNHEMRTSIMIAQEVMKKKRRLLGGGVFVADLHTLLKVCQDAFSFYVLVKTIMTKDENHKDKAFH